MATTISSGRANSPKLTANIADHGTIYGGRGLIFDGVTDYLDTGDDFSTTLTNNFTISAWIKPTDGQPAARGSICGTLKYDTYSGYVQFSLEPSGGIKLTIGTPTAKEMRNESSVVFSDGATDWAHVVAIFTKSSATTGVMTLYANGSDVTGTLTTQAGWNIESYSNPYSMYIGARNQTGTVANQYLAGNISDFKMFNTALTEAQVQELYLKPEQSAPSAVQDNLVAWYPMCEGNPDSPQSIVYDHSEKKLGSELVTNGSFDTDSGWTKGDGWTIADGVASSDETAQSTHSYLVQSVSFKSGALYRVSYDLVYNDSAGNGFQVQFLGSGTSAGTGRTSSGSYVEYITAIAAHTTFNIRSSDGTATGTIDNISVKEVLMGNHATTNFFGDELLTATNWTTNDGWGLSTGTLTYNDSSNGGTILSASDMTNSGLETGKTYQLKYTIGALSSGTASIRIDDSSGNNLIAEASEANGAYTKTFTASSTNNGLGFRFTGLTTSGSSFTVTSYSLKEVGVSSSGFATADSEPTIPQVPLLRYNEKMVFSSGKGTFVKWSNPNILPDSCTSFSYSVWFQINDTNVDDGVITFVDDLSSAGTGVGLRISSNRIVLTLKLDGSYEFLITGFTDTGWNHAVFVYDGSSYSNTKLYLNGYVFGTASSTSFPTSQNFANTELYLGNYYTETYNSMGGCIDEVSVYNITLSATEAQELFNDGVALDATTHSKKDYLVGYWRNDGVSSWVDRAPEKMAFDGTDDRVRYGNLINGFTSLTMASWFRVNTSSSTQNDIIGQFTNATTIGARLQSRAGSAGIWWATGNGSSSTIAIYSDSGAHRDGNWHHVVGTYDGSTLKLYFDGATTPVATASSSGLTFNDTNGFDIGGTYPEYMDGNIDECALWNTALTGTEVAELYALGLDGDILTHSNQTNLVSYWKNEGITTASWADKKGSNNPSSVAGSPTLIGGNDGTPAGSPESIIVREGLNSNKDGLGFPFTNPSNNVLRLNGSSEYVNLSDNLFSFVNESTATISAWIKPMQTANYKAIFTYGDTDGNTFIHFQLTDAEILTCGVRSAGSDKWVLNTDSAIQTEAWTHVAITQNGTSPILYVNGEAVNQTFSVTTDKTVWANNLTGIDNVHIGFSSYNNNLVSYWDGLLDEIKVYNRALSLAEIQKNYKHGKGKHKN